MAVTAIKVTAALLLVLLSLEAAEGEGGDCSRVREAFVNRGIAGQVPNGQFRDEPAIGELTAHVYMMYRCKTGVLKAKK